MSHSLYALAEPLIVALIVLVSAIVVLRKHAPKLWARFGGKAAGGACHDSDDGDGGCGSCGSCGSAEASREKPIHIHKAEH
ncbi:MAG: hypothetical protein JWM03_47 [Rhodocyclales bacterium]|nr:hypothetical protein [Rhodocyclales bacterium]